MWLYLQFVTKSYIYGLNKQLIIIRWSDWVMQIWRGKDPSKEIISPSRSACKPHMNVVEVISTHLTSTHHVHWQHKQKTSSFPFNFDLWMTLCSLIHFLFKGLVRRHADHSIGEVQWCSLLFLLTILVAYTAQHYLNIPSRDVMPSSQQPMRGTSREQNSRAVCECLDLSSGINQTGICPWGGDLIVCTDSTDHTHFIHLQNSQSKIRQSQPLQVCHQEWLCDRVRLYNAMAETPYTKICLLGN